jgi:hypothetical protein
MSKLAGGTFDSLESLLIFVFRQLQTALLSIDKIVEFLVASQHTVPIEGNGLVPAAAVPRRLIFNILANSEQFVRCGPPHSQIFALRPNNPLFQCDAAVAASIDQLLTENGPMTIDTFLASPTFAGTDSPTVERVLSVHSGEYAALPDGRIWFVNSPLPVQAAFDSLQDGIIFAFSVFTEGATPEELRRFLCLAPCADGLVTRMSVASVLQSKPELFVQIRRGTFALAGTDAARIPLPILPPRARASSARIRRMSPIGDDDEDKFNPESFFGGGFSFAPG